MSSTPLETGLPWDESLRVVVAGAEQCPLYALNDELEVEGRAVVMAAGKPVCVILAADIFQTLVHRMKSDDPHGTSPFDITCGGCEGRVRLIVTPSSSIYNALSDDQRRRVEGLVETLGRFSLFKTLKETELRTILPQMQAGDFEPGAVVIRQGEFGQYLYIVESGTVDVLAGPDDEVLLTSLEQGEIFGEMSLLSGTKVSATIRARTRCRILAIEGGQFSRMVVRYPSLQQYLFRMLTHRLRETNTLKEVQLAKGIKGNLDDLQLAELLQALHTARKSGRLQLKLPRGNAAVVMRDGALISIDYLGRGVDGFHELLIETEGTFSFSPEIPREFETKPALGDFMALLMEAFVRIDESRPEAKQKA